MPRKPDRPRRRTGWRSLTRSPEARAGWSLWLLADRMVEFGYANALSNETVRRTRNKRSQAESRQQVGDPSPRERRS